METDMKHADFWTLLMATWGELQSGAVEQHLAC